MIAAFLLAGLLAAPADAVRLTDFDNDKANARWQNVNDNVMGGRSLGDHSFEDGVMTFAGSINTNGGGFASVRLPIERGTLEGKTTLILRIKPDGRGPYRVLAYDGSTLTGRRGITYRGDITPDGPVGEWQTVTIELSKMVPSWRGDPYSLERLGPVEPAQIDQIGINLNDTEDGPFKLQVDWIDAS